MDERPPAGRGLAIVAFLLLVTAFWLPWWMVRYRDAGGIYHVTTVRPFAPEAAFTTTWGPYLAGALAAAAALLLFVRVAGASWRHEPVAWRRDLMVAAGLNAAAALATLLWPDDVPAFWGSRTFTNTTAGLAFTETASPGLGWWLLWLAAACAGTAAGLTGPRRPT